MTEAVRPVGWADVATKQDLLEARFASVDSRLAALETHVGKIEDKLDDISRELRAQTWKFTAWTIASYRAETSPGGTSTPVRPSAVQFRMPAVSDAITGSPWE